MYQPVTPIKIYQPSLVLFFIAIFCMCITSTVTLADGQQINTKQTDGKITNIVVTLKPLYSLVAQLTDGVVEPQLLIKQAQSSHYFHLRPSDRQLISDADLIIWFGPNMESSLQKVIQQSTYNQRTPLIISAMQAEGLSLLPIRSKHSEFDNHHNTEGHPQTKDPHIWLSVKNAIVISHYLAQSLKKIDPVNALSYKKNLQRLIQKIKDTESLINSTLHAIPDVSNTPFISYHDAYQYFEHEYQLNHIATISYDEDNNPGLKHLIHINKLINEKNIRCLIYQPPKPGIIDTLSHNTPIRVVSIDPAGSMITDDKNAWFILMQQMAEGFQQCLSE